MSINREGVKKKKYEKALSIRRRSTGDVILR